MASNPVETELCVLLIHGFRANDQHSRFNQSMLMGTTAKLTLDLLDFGRSDQPRAIIVNKAQEKANHCPSNYGRSSCRISVKR